jgi:SAM-dependent methyltransferase
MSHQCLICDNQVKEFTQLKNSKIYWHCQNCFFTKLDPSFHIDSAKEKARYDKHQNSIDDLGYVETLEKFIDYSITPFKESITNILDYGSGPEPVLAKLLKRKGYQTQIYDPFYAVNHYNNESFDFISSTEVFEHFYDPKKEIKKILNLLKVKGLIAIMTRFSPTIEEFKSWFYKDDETHVSFFTIRTFEYLAKELGFKIVKHDGFQNLIIQKDQP